MTDKLKIIPIGGLGEIGKNMTLLEYKDEIVIVDAGIMFPENDMLGIDAIIPDYNYLIKNNKLNNVKAVLLTHGHEDHVGAIEYLMNDVDAPIYATPLTAGLVEVKLRRAKLLREVDVITFNAGDTFKVGNYFTIEPFHVTHSIPDCVGFGIDTPVGLVVHTGDYKFDHTPLDGWAPDFARLADFSKRGVLCLLADSTNADVPGWTPSESTLIDAFDNLFSSAPGRIIVATFASLISRIQLMADMCIKHGRKLAITGRSMRDNTKMGRDLGYLKIPDDLLIDVSESKNYPANKVAIMATGSQGEPSAVMGRLARGRHRHMRVQENDTIVFSAHPIPGNEELIYRTINQLFRRGANVLYDRVERVHVSGHASREEMKLMLNLVRPQFLIPTHGELRHLKQHGELAQEIGIPAENIAVIENGTPVELDETSMKVLKRMSGGYVFVDGSSVGDIGWPVVNDREKLAQSGIFVAVLRTNGKGGVVGKPDMISRGFLSREEEDVLEGAEEVIRKVVSQHGNSRKDVTPRIEGALHRFLHEETGRRPIVHVVVH